MKSVSCPYRSYVLISREQIARNYRALRQVVGPGVEVAAVVKADAYGHGAVEISRIVAAEGATWLAVSSVEEGVTLRRNGIGAHILVMGGFLRHESEALLEFDLTPAVHSLAQIAEMDELSRKAARPIRYHLKIDSGMGRMGTRASAEDILQALNAAPHAHLEGLMTHFASAADYSKRQTEEQLAYFHALCERLREGGVNPAYLHTSSTIAVGYGRREGWHQMVRAGHALYGYVSPARGDAPAQLLEVKPAQQYVMLLCPVASVQTLRIAVPASPSGEVEPAHRHAPQTFRRRVRAPPGPSGATPRGGHTPPQ